MKQFISTATGRKIFYLCVTFFIFSLAACGGGGEDGNGGNGNGGNGPGVPSSRFVSGVLAIPGQGSLNVSWQNPNPESSLGNIIGFRITWVDLGDRTKTGTMLVTQEADDLSFERNTRVRYSIPGSFIDPIGYEITIEVVYSNRESAVFSVQITPAEIVASLVADPDIDGLSEDDNCPSAFNPKQTNTDDADDGGDACDADDDNDGVNDFEADGTANLDSCPRGETGWTSNATTDNDNDGCQDSGEDTDDDNDGVNDLADDGSPLDSCPRGETGWTSGSVTDNDGDGCRDDSTEDLDDDNDNVGDDKDAFILDACASMDTDKDGMPNKLVAGCTGSFLIEDSDDDNDGVNDFEADGTTKLDSCPRGETGWTSNASVDYDRDGCRDGFAEEIDDDNDGMNNLATNGVLLDRCPRGETGWTSNTSVDYDRDGCRDGFAEETDDDNDGVNNLATNGVLLDRCPRGETGWTSNASVDYDRDGCRDGFAEETDDDNDGVNNLATNGVLLDRCPRGETGWTSNASVDYDRDGCRDGFAEETDDDNDGVNDLADNGVPLDICPRGETGWTSNASVDYDRDGCRDGFAEETDDDNDGVNDLAANGVLLDRCPRGETGWTSNASVDYDRDGCRDGFAEETDDDNDGVNGLAANGTPLDRCPRGETGWTSNTSVDYDRDGCRDEFIEETDDDNDGVNDLADNGVPLDLCPRGETGWTSGPTTDKDNDGCRDRDEDVDDDNNGLIEVHNLDELALLRADLDGDGVDDNATDGLTALGDAGCLPSGCRGYELNRSLNFSDVDSYVGGSENMEAWTTGSGWTPIGSCSTFNLCSSYTGTFEGNNHSIADLLISAGDDVNGVGLFAALAGRIQNLHLLNANITGGGNYVGMLAGYGRGGYFENVSAEEGIVNSSFADNVGGLIGNGARATIRYSRVSSVPVFGGDISVGGLVGHGSAADIRNVGISGVSVFGRDGVGGLVGFGINADIRNVGISGVSVFGRNNVGGLVGFGLITNIRNVGISGVSVFGRNEVGGLIGSGVNADIRNSYTHGGTVSGRSSVGGLVGRGGGATIRYSYSAARNVSGNDRVGGLVSGYQNGTVRYSYWDTQTTGLSVSRGGIGLTTFILQNLTTFTGIYANWGNFWCEPNTGNVTEDIDANGPGGSFIRLWDLGTSSEYPALNCLPISVEQQRQGDDNRVPDGMNACSTGTNVSMDYDRDGCRDEFVEETDDDNDGVNDLADNGVPLDLCPRGETGWISGPMTDYDNDGCQDSGEDSDDDNDGVNDLADNGVPLDLCPRGETGWTSGPTTDKDNDGCRDRDEDVDDDNNGLIEVHNLDELALLRADLDGDGVDDNATDGLTALGNAGCLQSGCRGYELNRSLNFSDAASYAEGSGNMSVWTMGAGWTRIGFCLVTGRDSFECSNPYIGNFDGNNHSIADLFISVGDLHYGVGLFGAVGGSVQNLHLLNAYIHVSGDGSLVGILAGYGDGARFKNVHVKGGNVTSQLVGRVGSLVGYGINAAIWYSSVSDVSVYSSFADVGGLIGWGGDVDIRYSSVTGGSVSGNVAVGGLVGYGPLVDIRHSYVSGGSVIGDFWDGGLIGYGVNAEIRNSYASGGIVSGGGLVGVGDGAAIRNSYVTSGPALGSTLTGGLIGQTDDASTVDVSYWDNQTTGQSSSAGAVGNRGEGRTTMELQNPTTFTGIYAGWGNFWCDPNTGEEVTNTAANGPGGSFVRIWDLGNATQYPALNCVPGGLAAQGRDKQ